MADRFRITLGQLNPTVGDLAGNAALARKDVSIGDPVGTHRVLEIASIADQRPAGTDRLPEIAVLPGKSDRPADPPRGRQFCAERRKGLAGRGQ